MSDRPVIRWYGGKWMLAPWILGFLPKHRTYVEPFGGGGSVLLRKERSYAEVSGHRTSHRKNDIGPPLSGALSNGAGRGLRSSIPRATGRYSIVNLLRQIHKYTDVSGVRTRRPTTEDDMDRRKANGTVTRGMNLRAVPQHRNWAVTTDRGFSVAFISTGIVEQEHYARRFAASGRMIDAMKATLAKLDANPTNDMEPVRFELRSALLEAGEKAS